jgi:putative flavoprotein involved in K+ transport
VLQKPDASAEETADQWVRALGLALANADGHGLAELFLPDSHWRNLFGISWQFATISGSENLCHELGRRAREVRAGGFRLDATDSRLAGRPSQAARSSKPSSASIPSTAPASAPSG